MVSPKSHVIDLEWAALKAQKTLKAIAKASTDGTVLRTKALYGALGFCFATGLVFIGLAVASALIYAPFLVPLAGVCGILGGTLVSRDPIDRVNERSEELIEQAWSLRDREIDKLERQLKGARRDHSVRAKLIEKKISFLELATPDDLVAHYRLASGERQIIESHRGSMARLSDMRVPVEARDGRSG
ncbi:MULTISPECIES: hypothetical protein [Rhizobium]|uniref:hypothetical protein n=1 Tax=Rhizobium TaxID=379 RepID=UPI0010321347|nr:MULTISPECIES: hypothetical protein [Rhizobium]TBF24861.1 hypothetical protein ELG88_33680 [Rhizobium leguminosarum]WSH48952.1 hypothetical protein U8P77_35235 [Rhizobium johnstonii]